MSEHSPAPYGLERPVVSDARAAVHRVHGADGPAVWQVVTREAGVAGNEVDVESLERTLRAMTAADPVSRLCAHALRIRLSAHSHLAGVHHLTRS
jgi:hypothetical protein